MKIKLGALIFSLEIKNERWRNFLMGKYKLFLIRDGLEADFYISVYPQKRKRYSLLFSPDGMKAKIYTPLSLRRFKTFDFFLKTALATFFLDKKGFFLHASALRKNGQGLIFAGKKKSGKSTLVKLASNLKPLNDDFAIIRKIKNKFFVFSSPFHETNPIAKTNLKVVVDKLYFLNQSNSNSVKVVKKENCLPKIASLILSPLSLSRLNKNQEKLILEKIWTNANDFVQTVPCFMLYFKKDQSFLKFL